MTNSSKDQDSVKLSHAVEIGRQIGRLEAFDALQESLNPGDVVDGNLIVLLLEKTMLAKPLGASRWTYSEVRNRLEQYVKTINRWPGKKHFAQRMGCSVNTVQKAIESSDLLSSISSRKKPRTLRGDWVNRAVVDHNQHEYAALLEEAAEGNEDDQNNDLMQRAIADYEADKQRSSLQENFCQPRVRYPANF